MAVVTLDVAVVVVWGAGDAFPIGIGCDFGASADKMCDGGIADGGVDASGEGRSGEGDVVWACDIGGVVAGDVGFDAGVVFGDVRFDAGVAIGDGGFDAGAVVWACNVDGVKLIPGDVVWTFDIGCVVAGVVGFDVWFVIGDGGLDAGAVVWACNVSGVELIAGDVVLFCDVGGVGTGDGGFDAGVVVGDVWFDAGNFAGYSSTVSILAVCIVPCGTVEAICIDGDGFAKFIDSCITIVQLTQDGGTVFAAIFGVDFGAKIVFGTGGFNNLTDFCVVGVVSFIGCAICVCIAIGVDCLTDFCVTGVFCVIRCDFAVTFDGVCKATCVGVCVCSVTCNFGIPFDFDRLFCSDFVVGLFCVVGLVVGIGGMGITVVWVEFVAAAASGIVNGGATFVNSSFNTFKWFISLDASWPISHVNSTVLSVGITKSFTSGLISVRNFSLQFQYHWPSSSNFYL